MANNFLDIEEVTPGMETKIKQTMKFKTGNFIWKVKFNTTLDSKTVNNMNLYVTSLNLAPLKTAIRYDTINNTIEIEPLEPYAQNESYYLNISKNVKSKGGKYLKSAVKLKFKIPK